MNAAVRQTARRRLVIKQEKNGEETVLSLDGSVDTETVTALQKTLDLVSSIHGANVRIVCAGLECLNSSGIGAIYNAYRRCAKAGGSLVLSSVPTKIQELIDLLGLSRVLLDDSAPATRGTNVR